MWKLKLCVSGVLIILEIMFPNRLKFFLAALFVLVFGGIRLFGDFLAVVSLNRRIVYDSVASDEDLNRGISRILCGMVSTLKTILPFCSTTIKKGVFEFFISRRLFFMFEELQASRMLLQNAAIIRAILEEMPDDSQEKHVMTYFFEKCLEE